MKAERWQQLDRLFHLALEREPCDRAAFLDAACATDDSLHKQLEALLAAQEEAGSFIQKPALQVEARSLADEQTELTEGQTIRHYRIISRLGMGGMGEVYLAQDERLDRKVALKILPAMVAADQQWMGRFIQEAKAASALNHPNIITIHEIDQADSIHFIAIEFIDGETLRHRLTRARMAVHEALDVSIQVALAVAAAHEVGIIHRDIKPENIMIRRDGIVKVLDFGLAKLMKHQQAVSVDAQGATKVLVKTEPGIVMGTPQYMSPEQARGIDVDARTDIWSLGCVLYEMVAGQPPFVAPTPIDAIVSILERDPPPMTLRSEQVPGELERIARKALQKDREDRYQVVKDMALDLKGLRQDLEVEAQLERSVQPASGGEVHAITNDALAVETNKESTSHTEDRTEEVRLTSSAPSASYLVSEIKRHKTVAVITLAIFLIAAVGFALYKFSGRNAEQKKATLPFQTTKITKLTTGRAFEAAISPDGKYVAYLLEDAGKQSLWVRQVVVASQVQLAPPSEGGYQGVTFSPDGNYVYYLARIGARIRSRDFALYQVPALGGEARKVLEDVPTKVTFSPDGKRFAFVRRTQGGGDLMIANADGTGVRQLASAKSPILFFSQGGPAWSPDGKIIAINLFGDYRGVAEVRVEDGMVKPLTSQKWEWFGQMAWLSDGSGLIINARDPKTSVNQMWHVSYPSGEARKLTNNLNGNYGVSLTADSHTMVTTESNVLSNIWVMPTGETSRATQITSGGSTYYDLSWTPDGRILYASDASGNADIWVMNADGSRRRQLTVDVPRNYGPTMSPDGRYIFFHSNRAGAAFSIWRMNEDGSNQKQLTTSRGIYDSFPHCSPDSKWIVYSSAAVKNRCPLWKVSVEGGDPVLLNDRYTAYPVVSPDGQLIACWYNHDEFQFSKIALIPYAGGTPIKILELAPTVATEVINWTTDGRALAYFDNRGRVSNIWLQPIVGGNPVQLTDFKTDQIFSFALSPDGKRLAVSRGTETSDVVLISDLR